MVGYTYFDLFPEVIRFNKLCKKEDPCIWTKYPATHVMIAVIFLGWPQGRSSCSVLIENFNFLS